VTNGLGRPEALKRPPAPSTVRCEYGAVPRSAVTCAVCHYLRVEGSFSDAGDIFICSECQANAKNLFEIQDRIWPEIAETSESTDGTEKSPDS
jgi:hypothetical protein